ncbi:DUF1614 domain-containing protein [Phormidesmis sp. 146-12]
MRSIRHQLIYWFALNFDLIREESGWVILPRSGQGCLLLLLVFLPFVLLSFGYTIFLIFKIYPIVYSTLMTRLGIASGLGLPLVITAFLGCFINLPFFILTRHDPSGRRKLELLPLWLLKRWASVSDRTRYQPYGYIGINLAGGLIPIVLALYQFHRVQPLTILIVTAIVTSISYFLVTVIPGKGIVTCRPRFWLITTIAALSAMALVSGGVDRASVAFAGGVLGTTIGADLLHLKDVRPENAGSPLSIGGAGFDDGIVQCGLCALIIAEWLPAVVGYVLGNF